MADVMCLIKDTTYTTVGLIHLKTVRISNSSLKRGSEITIYLKKYVKFHAFSGELKNNQYLCIEKGR